MNTTSLFPSLLAVSLLVSVSACAQSPDGIANGGTTIKTIGNSSGSTSDSATVASQTAALTQVRDSQLTPQLMYQFLLGEIAGQRGEMKLSAEAYADLAVRTRDARVARRATEVALYARQSGLALRNARLWQELEPDSAKAQQTLASLLVSGGRLSEAKPYVESWLKHGKPEQVFLQMHSLLSRQADKQAVLGMVTGLAAGYPALPEAHFAVAQAAWQAGQGGTALGSIDAALKLKPDWQTALLFKAQVLQQKDSDAAAIAVMASHLQLYPFASEVRTAYAKQLARAGRMDEAKEAFSTLIQQMPENPEPHFALGLVAMQGNDLNAAEASFKRALELRYEDEGTLNFLLGQVSEAQGAAEVAIARYKTVTGRQQLDAGLRAAMLMGKAGRLPEARAWLAEMAALQSANADDRIARIAQTESQLLRDAKRYAEAFDVLDKALLRVPDGIELLYDRAMAAEKLNRLDVLERDLRRMIELKPDYAHAYNALGYTLADRTNRLSEAVTLLEKALSLAPEDPFILDSMGWALYKTKRYSEAISFLRRAYQARPDPDIAAHLGEVLWVKGERDEARKIWQNGLKLHPDNETLREVQSRLAP